MASILAEKHAVALYVRNSELAADLRRERQNVRYLPGVSLPDNLRVVDRLEPALEQAKIVVVATPSHGVRAAARALAGLLPPDCVVVSAAKGLEVGSCLRMTEVLAQEIPALAGRIAALSGPNHAEEVGRKIPSATVAGCADRGLVEFIQDAFMTPYFRVYANHDVAGVELGGALKNVIALAAGIGAAWETNFLGIRDTVQPILDKLLTIARM